MAAAEMEHGKKGIVSLCTLQGMRLCATDPHVAGHERLSEHIDCMILSCDIFDALGSTVA